jgi:drug/metabolite transporter (DMT)-like permease
MSSLALTLILFSALMHALWNLLVKRSRDKTAFIWWMFCCSGAMFSLALLLMPEPFPLFTLRIALLASAGAVCFVAYHLFTGRAYQQGDLSLTYPLAQTSMVYVPLWGMLLLGERLSLLGTAGILLIIFGAYCIQLRALSFSEVLRPFRNLRKPSVQAALAAGFIYSVGSVIDKTGVMDYHPLYFTYLLVVIMFAIMSCNLLRPSQRGRITKERQHNLRLILLSGPIMMGSFISFRYALKLAPLSYAVPVRQVSLLIGVLIGVLFLGEICGRIRIMASLLILAGVFQVRFG